MAEHNDLGKIGEEKAADYLREQGYEILETNWIFQKAEIDIIAKKEDMIAVIEVKTRSSIYHGLPQEFVKTKKIQLILKAINEYVNINDIELEIRFDIISVVKEGELFKIEHLIDAFYHF